MTEFHKPPPRPRSAGRVNFQSSDFARPPCLADQKKHRRERGIARIAVWAFVAAVMVGVILRWNK